MRTFMTRQFKQRLLIGIMGILVLFICIYYSNLSFFKPIFVSFNVLIIVFALKEYYHLSTLKGFYPLTSLGIAATALYLFALFYSFDHPHLTVLPSFILLMTLLFSFLFFFSRQTASLGNLAVTLFGFVYLVLPLSCALRINYFPHSNIFEEGRLWLTYVLIVSKVTDIGAYFCGKSIGKTKLAPLISPQKTLEGALGGVVLALFASFLFSFFSSSSQFSLTIGQSLWLGLLISVLAQLGDLAESLIKRDAGVKDSSALPGFGGVLDLVDSLVFTLPLVYLWMILGSKITPVL